MSSNETEHRLYQRRAQEAEETLTDVDTSKPAVLGPLIQGPRMRDGQFVFRRFGENDYALFCYDEKRNVYNRPRVRIDDAGGVHLFCVDPDEIYASLHKDEPTA